MIGLFKSKLLVASGWWPVVAASSYHR